MSAEVEIKKDNGEHENGEETKHEETVTETVVEETKTIVEGLSSEHKTEDAEVMLEKAEEVSDGKIYGHTNGVSESHSNGVNYESTEHHTNGVEYRSNIAQRPAFTRTIPSTRDSINGSGRILKIVTETMHTSSIGSGMPSYGQGAASTIRDARERDRRDIMDLNDKLASYIEKVRFLSAQNRKLNADLAFINGRVGSAASSVRIIIETEIATVTKTIASTSVDREKVEKEMEALSKSLEEYKKKFDEATRGRASDREELDALLIELSNLEAEINLLKRRIELLDEEIARLKKENARLTSELQRCRTQTHQESMLSLDARNRVTMLLEEIAYMKGINEKEIFELQARAARDTTAENRDFFKNELSNAIRDLRKEYDDRNAADRSDVEQWYIRRVQEIETQSARTNKEQDFAKDEVSRLKRQMSELRSAITELEGRNALLEGKIEMGNAEMEDENRAYEARLNDKDNEIRRAREHCQAQMIEMQMLLDAKQTLEAETDIYRRLLEGADDGEIGMRQLVEQVVRTKGVQQDMETETMRVIKGETSQRTSNTRSARGNVSIQEVCPDGNWIILENTHRKKNEAMGGWKIKRKIDGKREIVYTFPEEFTLQPGKKVTIFARGKGVESPPDSLVFHNQDTFGTGSNISTLLFNRDGEERATLIQKMTAQTTHS